MTTHMDTHEQLASQTTLPKRLTPEEVYREYGPQVQGLAARMLGNSADAADVAQEVLLQVVRNLSRFRGEASLATWLHRITVNAVNLHRRKTARMRQRQVPMFPEVPEEDCRRGGPALRRYPRPEEELIAQETRELIDAAIAQLPKKERDTFVLADVEGLPNATIGATLGLSLPAVKSRLHRARMHLRQTLSPHLEHLAG